MSAEAGGGESCLSKESGTTTSQLESHGLEYQLGIYDFQLPGLGDPGEMCGSNRVPEKKAVCPNGDAVRYVPMLCRRVECPDCYSDWSRERAFSIAVEIEARARQLGERPHALFASVEPDDVRSMDAINQKLFRRFYRRFEKNESQKVRCEHFEHTVENCSECYTERNRCSNAGSRGHRISECPKCSTKKIRCKYANKSHCVEDCSDCYTNVSEFGGYGFFHHCRIKRPRKEGLRRCGYGDRGNKGGLWTGVRDDALDLGDWRKYVKWGPHLHSIGFPGHIEPHKGDDFLIRKYDNLEDAESVVAHIRYLLSHGAVRERDGECRMTRPFGSFHHGSSEWKGAENELSETEYNNLASEIAQLIGMEWDKDERELVYQDSGECPECGESKSNFIDIRDVPGEMDHTVSMSEPFTDNLDIEAREFFREIVEILHTASDPRIFDGDIDHPNSVAKWVDDDPPPGNAER